MKDNNTFKIGDPVIIINGAIYKNNNKEVPKNLLNIKLYIREIKDNNCYTIGRAKTGAVLGDISADYLKLFIDKNTINIKPYVIYVPNHDFPLYHSPSKNSGVIRRINRGLNTIIDEKNGFGKIKNGTGWIELTKVLLM